MKLTLTPDKINQTELTRGCRVIEGLTIWWSNKLRWLRRIWNLYPFYFTDVVHILKKASNFSQNIELWEKCMDYYIAIRLLPSKSFKWS